MKRPNLRNLRNLRSRLVTPGVLAALLAALLMVQVAGAMGSTNYGLEWYEMLVGGGGPKLTSAHYAVDATVGQASIALSSSAHYQVGLGYWFGALMDWLTRLPILVRNAHF
jgi:hypothetical protein